MAGDPREAARTYFDAWQKKDFARVRAVLDDAVTFRGPLGSADGAEQCLAGLRGMSQIVSEININKMWADGPDVLTWFDLHTKPAPPVPTANWMHIENGRIARIRVTFDPRELLS